VGWGVSVPTGVGLYHILRSICFQQTKKKANTPARAHSSTIDSSSSSWPQMALELERTREGPSAPSSKHQDQILRGLG
jgi:hypothetical protein